MPKKEDAEKFKKICQSVISIIFIFSSSRVAKKPVCGGSDLGCGTAKKNGLTHRRVQVRPSFFYCFVLPIFFRNKLGLEDEIKIKIKFIRTIFQLN